MLLLLALSCVTPPADPPAASGELRSALASLTLSFTDPGTLVRYTIEGPYRHVGTTAAGVEVEGFDMRRLSPARVLLFVRDGAVWALARIEGREFLTRVS